MTDQTQQPTDGPDRSPDFLAGPTAPPASQPQQPPSGSPDRSPDFLTGPTLRQTGGRRLTRVPVYILIGISALVAIAIAYTMNERAKRRAAGAGSTEVVAAPEPVDAKPLFGAAQNAGIIEARRAAPAPAAPAPAAAATPAAMPAAPPEPMARGYTTNAGRTPEDDARMRAWQQYDAEVRRVEEQRRAALKAALEAPTTVPTNRAQPGQMQQPAAAGPGGAGNSPQALAQLANSFGSSSGTSGGLGAAGGGAGGYGSDMGRGGQGSGAEAKRNFLNQQPRGSHYLAGTREAAVSPYEVKAGTIIPGVMESGINSDLPGIIKARVRENVYDTATGQYLLIPKDSMLVGTYDNGVEMGQERVLIAWNRIIYPDASSLDLGSMPGADQSGYAGFSDQVNNHYFRTFGNALLLSIFSAGVQLSQPQQRGDSRGGYDAQQIIAGSLGQQMGQLGAEYARKGLNVAPTLEIRPGYRFNIMVTKDMIIPPWQG
ncbi:TrbI/VirB10 family protein [Azospirillum thermophilum]|uniref:Conjugal transfer protein TrbI n=1 Tax=Azospirillum thermophilum TaxID=2202148 RepID=A0A2S2CVS0_9PROT|nr:TrbI/VirB10 family protein [Azospirillum thermophilum]AWK88613.1 conjugal transfer protein TrbI [Azospirillum thermophilum]